MNNKAIRAFLLSLAAFSISIGGVQVNAATLFFDRLYTVGSAGSTTPVTEFDINGPAPVLFVDLPRAGFITSVSSDWFHDPDLTVQFNVSKSGIGLSDQLWLSPTAADWDSKKAVGIWSIDASFRLTDLICLENGGICAPVDGGSGTGLASFTVTDVPEPSSVSLLGFGVLAMFGLARLRKQNG